MIATCRSSSPELDVLGSKVLTGVDVTSEQSVLNLRKFLNGTKIDVLILNAAIAENISLENFNVESIRRQFEVNALCPLSFTVAMLGNLREGSKVILMTSRI